MLYEDLQQRYGNHIAKRVQRELNRGEFSAVALDRLRIYLEARAEKAAQDCKALMDNPLDRGSVKADALQALWRNAEDLAYLLSIAEDVSVAVRATVVARTH
jgi:hypothetical protein